MLSSELGRNAFVLAVHDVEDALGSFGASKMVMCQL